jgi:uncharacterized protein YprB with RNaseH-like and TPR domain
MLKHTFVHINGIGMQTEQNLWKKNIITHQNAIESKYFSSHKLNKVIETKQKLVQRDALYFHNNIPSKERWRMFGEFYDSVAYIDIETTGLYGFDDIITTIALYDGKDVKHYVHGQNLNDFKNDIKAYKLLVTYNGTNFDLPFIQRFLNISMDYAHIDLRYILASLGYSGGLKGCEKQLGLFRSDIVENINGNFAVWLWKYYKRHKSEKALNTLLSYNIEDVLSLEKLMIIAYNKKVSEFNLITQTFLQKKQPVNPFIGERYIIDEIKKGIEKYGSTYLTENQIIKSSNNFSLRDKYVEKKGGDLMYAIPNVDFFKDDNNKKNIPSKAKTPWVFVKSISDSYPKRVDKKGGKWLIFVPEKDIDITWFKIRKSILNNSLVRNAKCSTIIKNKHNKQNKTDCVICVYTYDYSDKEDVFSVRKKLRELGFTNKIYYKTDEATLEKKYKNNGKSWLYAE